MRSTSRSLTRLLACALAALAIALAAPGQLLSAPPTTWLVSFTIDDEFPGDGPGATSDGFGAYTDYRLVGIDYPPEGCIEAEPTSTGHLHAVFNRRLDDDTRCNPERSDRQYTLRLADAAGACALLLAAYGDGVLASGDDCELTYTNNPRVRVSDLFKKGSPSTTPVAFLAGGGVNGKSYEIRMYEPVPMTLDGANTRTVTHPATGQAYLFEFANGKGKVANADPFYLPFKMTFTRSTVQ